MKNSLKLIFSLVFLAVFTLVFTSCEKENIDEVIEEVVEEEETTNDIPPTDRDSSTIGPSKNGVNYAAIEFQGSTTVINAYAAYCNQNNKEFLTITNNQALLSSNTVFSIDIQDLNDEDFIIAYMIDSLGGAPQDVVLWSNVDTTQAQTQIDLLVGTSNSFTFSVDTVANTVKGNMSGMFLGGIIGGTPVNAPFTIDFDASILQTHTFCD